LTKNGIFVLEKRPAERLSTTDFWEVIRRKTYGATETLFLQRKESATV
jgi:16S rRNA G966 N2-methylase RsmD